MKRMVSANREQYLSKEQTTSLKGLLAIGVLLAHTVPAAKVFQGSILSPLVGSLGYLCVAVFFFLSGYGIMAQYQAKKEQYLKGFLRTRVLSIYLLTLFLILLYSVFYKVIGATVSRKALFQSFLIGDTVVSNGWYLQVVLLFYIFWYITVGHIRRESAQLPALCVFVIGYMLIGMFCMAHFWYQSSLGFLMGVFWQRNKQKLDNYIYIYIYIYQVRTRRFAMLAAAVVAFAATYFLSTKAIFINASLSGVFKTVMGCFSAAAFVAVILISSILFGNLLNCGVLRFMGKLSMEVYVLQGIPLHLFKVGALKIENGWLYIAGVIAATILLAVVMHPAIQFVTNIPKKYLQRGK